jgi:hypothetical protein
MLKGTVGFAMGWIGIFVGAALFLPSCGGSGETGGAGCTPNETQGCACTDGSEGNQTCNSDGTAFSPCSCNGGGGNGGSTGSAGDGGGQTIIGACGDGIEDQGECDTGSENFCPEDCMPGTGGAGGTTMTTTSDPCEGHVTFAGLVADVGSAWGDHPGSNGKTGYEAGVEICKTIGADHPCDYEEVLDAEAAGELAAIPQGTTAWIHRTTDAMVGGVASPAGAGGRCNNWVYKTNHISDGEYATFNMVGIPTYVLDNDTFYDGVDTTHTITGDLQCGGVNRSLFCCFPLCTP